MIIKITYNNRRSLLHLVGDFYYLEGKEATMEVGCKEKIVSNEYADWFIDFSLTDDIRKNSGEEDDFCLQEVEESLGIVHVKRSKEQLIDNLSFEYQYLPELYGLQWSEFKSNIADINAKESKQPADLDSLKQELHMASQNIFDSAPLEISGIIRVQNKPLELTGKGCVLAFIDTGIDYNHPVFKRQDGSSRILAIWDQSIQTGTPPQDFLYGSEFTKEQIEEAMQLENPYELINTRDEIGHGTAMASVAAGSKLKEGTEFLGIAYDCDIVVVKLKECKPYLKEYYLIPDDAVAYQGTDVIMALKYLDQFAIMFQRPIIYVMGIGSNYGGHTGNGQLSMYMERIAKKRSRALVLCGGNEGDARHHYQGTFRENDNDLGQAEVFQNVEIRVGEKEKGFLLEIWGSIPNIFTISIRTPGGEVIANTGIGNGRMREYRFIYENTRVFIYYAPTEQSSGDPLILIRCENPTAGIWTITVKNETELLPASFHMWLPIAQFLSSETYFLKPSPDMTLTVPSYVDEVMVTSTYNSVNNSFYVASGRGFSRDNLIKPDISAPGVLISVTNKKIGNQILVEKITGSSMAAAIVAGAVTQFMQWAIVEQNEPYVGSEDIKNYFIRGAVRENDLSYPSQLWGYGKLDIFNTFENIRRM